MALAGLCALAVVAATALALPAQADTTVPAVPCPLSLQPGATFPPPPTSLNLPAGVDLPPDAAVYASGANATIAPRGWTCSGFEGADSSLGQEVQRTASLSRGADFVQSIGNFGGLGVDISAACEYFPNLTPVVDPDNIFCQNPDPAPGPLTPLPTGANGVYATLLRPPAGTDAGGSPIPPGDHDYALFIATVQPDGVGVSGTDCALPASQVDICVADLALFLKSATSLPAEQRQPLVDRVTDLLEPGARAVASANAGENGQCHGHFDASVEREIHQLSTRKIPLQVKGIGLPAKFSGGVGASAALGEMTICESALTAALRTELPTFDGDVSLGASETGGKVDGPFEYSLPALRWVSVPDAPPHQHFETSFSAGKVSFEVNPSLGLAFTSNEGVTPGLSLSLASVTIQAPHADVTLVSAGSSLLEAGVGPTLTLSAEISKSAAEQATEDGESEGEPEATAVSDAAEEISADADAGLYEEALNFYDVVLDDATLKAMYNALDTEAIEALNADPAVPTDEELADEPSPDAEAADEVPFDDVSADTEAALDADLGDALVDVGAELFEILPFLAF